MAPAVSHRDFLKLTAFSLGSLGLNPWQRLFSIPDFPQNENDWHLGCHRIWHKSVSLPLSGDSSSVGWDLPAVGWTSLFIGAGVAIHSTYWHNNYGEPSSRGCVNASPDDSKWVFRWTIPEVAYDPGDVTVSMPGGTLIEVIES